MEKKAGRKLKRKKEENFKSFWQITRREWMDGELK